MLSGCNAETKIVPEGDELQENFESVGSESGDPYPIITSTPRVGPTLAYPAPEITATIFPETMELIVPTPGNNSGVVTGKVLNEETGEPFAFYTVYLGFKIHRTPGPGYDYGLKEQESPHTVVAPDGSFVLADVPPGEYLFIVFHPKAISVVMESNSDMELEVRVQAGEIVDLGIIEAMEPGGR